MVDSWQDLLGDAIADLGQAETARRLGVSPAAVSLAANNKYPADTAVLAQKITKTFGDDMEQETVPEGYKKNGVGHLVPLEMMKDEELARDDFVMETIKKASAIAAQVADFKDQLSGDMQAWLDMAADKYGAQLGGVRGNVTLTSFDGRYQLLRAVSDRWDFDEALQAAKSLIDECLRDWTKNGPAEVRALIDNAFQVDKKGRINAKRILGLRKLKIDDPRWLRAMEAISDSMTVIGSCTYFRFYERDNRGNYKQIQLDFSGV